jgi:hypothetical protein
LSKTIRVELPGSFFKQDSPGAQYDLSDDFPALRRSASAVQRIERSTPEEGRCFHASSAKSKQIEAQAEVFEAMNATDPVRSQRAFGSVLRITEQFVRSPT